MRNVVRRSIVSLTKRICQLIRLGRLSIMAKKIPLKNNNEILNNIFRLIQIKGVRQTDLAKYLGISRNAISQWKINRSSSYMDYLDKIALYFDISTDDLLHPDKTNLHDTFLSQDEMELLTNYRLLKDEHLKKALMTVLSTFIECSIPGT